jgi:hypothetical protein
LSEWFGRAGEIITRVRIVHSRVFIELGSEILIVLFIVTLRIVKILLVERTNPVSSLFGVVGRIFRWKRTDTDSQPVWIKPFIELRE